MGKNEKMSEKEKFKDEVFSYKICEMKVVWKMYGGKELGKEKDKNNKKKKKKKVKIEDK
jgi:hypothetical protein